MSSWNRAAGAAPSPLLRHALASLKQHYAWEYSALGEAEATRKLQAGLVTAHRQGLGETPQAVLFALGQVLADTATPGYDATSWATTCRRSAPGHGVAKGPWKGALTIRAAQMQAFEAPAKPRPQDRLLAHLRRVFPERMRALSPAAALALVEAGMATAQRHGIQDAKSVTLLTDLVVVKGPGFEDTADLAWSGAILRSASIPSEEKAGMILRMLKQRGSEVPDATNR
ncbi:hypothetical protein ACLEPN_17755 [Myxococcus sp. 1LA]